MPTIKIESQNEVDWQDDLEAQLDGACDIDELDVITAIMDMADEEDLEALEVDRQDACTAAERIDAALNQAQFDCHDIYDTDADGNALPTPRNDALLRIQRALAMARAHLDDVNMPDADDFEDFPYGQDPDDVSHAVSVLRRHKTAWQHQSGANDTDPQWDWRRISPAEFSVGWWRPGAELAQTTLENQALAWAALKPRGVAPSADAIAAVLDKAITQLLNRGRKLHIGDAA